jgi:membrane associated rhomboid family serine protease
VIPYKVDTLFDYRPIANWLIFGVLILVFSLQVLTSEKKAVEKRPLDTLESPLDALEAPLTEVKVTEEEVEEPAVRGPMRVFVLESWGITGLLGHNWLHSNVIQLIANLLFLWPLGNAVCSKLGNKIYPVFYFDLCLIGGVIHVALGGGPALGASMAVAGIVGMYLVLFPENSISCYFLLPHPVELSISGYWVIFLWLVIDIFGAIIGVNRICFCAHIVGFGSGFGLAVLMLKKKWLVMERDERSLLELLRREKEEGGKEEEEVEEKTRELEVVEKQPEGADTETEKAVAERAAPKVEKRKDEFIRFTCQCGHKIKVRRRDVGKTGRCPKCSAWVEAPRE